MPDASPRPARRFLHVCYCCDDTEPIVKFFVDNLAMRNTMSTPTEKGPGDILGMESITGAAAFVYDARGPRQSPAIEVQSWIEPPLMGEPVQDPTAAGIQALGFAVPDLEGAVETLTGAGCSVIGTGQSPFGESWTTLTDTTGVTLDLVADPTVPAGETRMHHLRITSTDLAASIPWYEGLGFEIVDRADLDDAGYLGRSEASAAEVVRMRLPDEPFEAVLIQWSDPPSHGRHSAHPNQAGIFRTAVGVEDTRAAYESMSRSGWTFDRPPMSVELKGTPVPDMWICFLSDPDGVPFEFVERPRSAFKA